MLNVTAPYNEAETEMELAEGEKKKKSLSGTKRVKSVEYPSSFIVLRVRLNLWRAAVSGG